MLYQIESTSYDDASGIIKRKIGEIKLTKTQKNLLNYFIQNPKIILSKQTLMDEVWGRVVTENSVDQIISILRNHLEENPSKPTIIVTHFGQGISFEVEVDKNRVEKSNDSKSKLTISKFMPMAAIVVLFIAVIWVFNFKTHESKPQTNNFESYKNKKILILPMTFKDTSINKIEQNGMKNSLKTIFNNLDSEGRMIFDETSMTTQQAIEKHWKIDSDLLIVRTDIIKNGDIYEAIVELSNGVNSQTKTTLTGNNINELLNSQISFIGNYNNQLSGIKNNNKQLLSPDQKYIEALGYKKLGNLNKATELIKEIMAEKEDNYQARLLYAEILFEEKEYDKSLSQLNTLKATSAYQLLGAEIELDIAKIKLAKNQFKQVVSDLNNFQSKHLDLSEIKKSKIQIQLGKAYLALGEIQNSMNAYKQSISNISQQLNPELFALSYYGQGKVLIPSSVDKKVFSLFEKSLDYAQLANNIHLQILALNEMSFISLSIYDWEKAISYTKQALSLLEQNNDKFEIGKGLGNLVAILNLRGQFTEAKQINERLGRVANEIESSNLQLHYLHYRAILAMNEFDWQLAQQLINKQFILAKETNDYGMQLNNAFLALELILLKKDNKNFMSEWDKRELLIKDKKFERFQIYMDLYLARYYIQTFQNTKAIELINQVSEKALQTGDIKILVDAQNRLAEAFLTFDAKEALKVLNNMEQYNPHPNPYLDLKAQALYKLDKNIEALNILNQAKSVYHESWTAENEALLGSITAALK